MNVRSGFSIVECLVYCFLFCLLCVLIFDWVGASQISLAKIHKKSVHLLDAYGAMDSFVQDALSAPSEAIAWKKITENEIIWQTHEGAVGWAWSGASLYRTTGTYDAMQWTRSTKNLVSNSLARVQFAVHRNKRDEAVRITCNFDEAARSIALHNRRWHGKAY